MRTPKDKVKLAQVLTEAALRKRRRAQTLLEEAEQDLAKAGLMLQEVAADGA